MGGSKTNTSDPQVNTSSNNDTKSETTTVSKPDLELINSSVENSDYVHYIIGTVKNNTDHQYGYVQVEINLYDKAALKLVALYLMLTI